MRLKLANLGPIQQVELDLTPPLTILTGANNSGKTWVAWSVYAITKCHKELPVVREVVEELIAAPNLEVNLEGRWEGLRERAWVELPSVLVREIGDCFGVKLAAGAGVEVIANTSELLPQFYNLGSYNFSVVIQPPGIRIDHWEGDLHRTGIDVREMPEILREILLRYLPQVLLGVDFRVSHVLPAERPGISLFAREIAGRKLEDAFGARIVAIDQRYPWPIRDSLRAELLTYRYSLGEDQFEQIAQTLENEVLQGTVQRTDRGDLQFGASSGPISLHVSSSMVKSLARFVEYLRYQAQPGNILIVDEPELNLHPDNQRAVARAIAEAVNAGLRVVLTTHSDWFLRELNRLVLANRLPAEKLAAHGLRKEQAIDPSKIGLYLMEAGSSRRLRCDGDGLDMGSIDDATNRLNHAEQQMYLALEEELP